jgi:hypothetical protein
MFIHVYSKASRALSNLVVQFRKICNHPFVFPEVRYLVCGDDAPVDELIYRAAGKFEFLDRIMPKLFRTGHRILMFFQMTQVYAWHIGRYLFPDHFKSYLLDYGYHGRLLVVQRLEIPSS